MLARKFIRAGLLLLALAGSLAFARPIHFDLQGPEGQVTEKSYPGRYLLLAIGFTSCPDICPTTLYEFGKAMKSIKNPDAIQPLFVTIDPLNDDITRLNAYTGYFDPRIVGLGGEMENIQSLADTLGASFGYHLDGRKIKQPQPGMPYTVYHSTLIYLISPERELIDAFDYQLGAEKLTQALDKVLGGVSAATRHTETKETTAKAAPASVETDCALPAGFQKAKKALAQQDIMPDADMGKPALITLWALWCEPCRTELPLLDAWAGAQDKMAVLALNLGDSESDIAALFAALKIRHLAQFQAPEDALERFAAVGLPFSALFVEGRLLAVKSGVIKETDSLAAFAQCLTQP